MILPIVTNVTITVITIIPTIFTGSLVSNNEDLDEVLLSLFIGTEPTDTIVARSNKANMPK